MMQQCAIRAAQMLKMIMANPAASLDDCPGLRVLSPRQPTSMATAKPGATKDLEVQHALVEWPALESRPEPVSPAAQASSMLDAWKKKAEDNDGQPNQADEPDDAATHCQTRGRGRACNSSRGKGCGNGQGVQKKPAAKPALKKPAASKGNAPLPMRKNRDEARKLSKSERVLLRPHGCG